MGPFDFVENVGARNYPAKTSMLPVQIIGSGERQKKLSAASVFASVSHAQAIGKVRSGFRRVALRELAVLTYWFVTVLSQLFLINTQKSVAY